MLKTITRLSAAAMSLSGLLAIPGCHAEPRPPWELGAGISVLRMPDYRGSDVTNVHVLPVPYLVYRGEFLKADQGGLRGLLFESERLEINISLNGTLPALDDDNPARQGMDELKPTAEVGPTADFHLWRSADRKTRLDLRLPVRTAITVESDPRQIGWLFSPNLILELRDPAGLPGWNLSLQGGPYFNDRDDNLSGAVYEDSPLVETQHAVAAGVAVSWVFGESSRRVEVGE